MKKRKIFASLLLLIGLMFSLTSCLAGAFEKEINVVFKYEDEFIDKGTVSQFKNYKTPGLTDAYIPEGYKFFGWTPLNPDEVFATDENFKEEYIGAEKMVHWAEVEKYAVNSTVVCQALLIDKEEIPKEYHYVVIAWYDKTSTSGLSADKMETFTNSLKTYLSAEGVTEEDLNTIIIRGYTGNVGPSCGSIMEDGDVDIMFGWGSIDNVVDVGGMKEGMLLETVSFNVTYEGAAKSRTIHRLTESETVIKVMEWMKSDECRNLFN